jgi:hypothetical protein
MRFTRSGFALSLALIVGFSTSPVAAASYEDLTQLFSDWREFEQATMLDGAPDYTAATMASKLHDLQAYRSRLGAINAETWPLEQQVDYQLLRAEMNGMEFNIKVLKPWQRDPAWYVSIFMAQSDTPAHEGPEHHSSIDLWTYADPLTQDDQADLAGSLRTIPPLLKQARGNLSGNARELWLAGIGNITGQAENLDALAARTEYASEDFKQALVNAKSATVEFAEWLNHQAESKTGPSGVGKDNYTWYLRNVHLVPLSWEQEVALLERELARAHSSLKLEESRNSNLPPLKDISSPEEYDQRWEQAINDYLLFLEQRKIMPMADYMGPALRAQTGQYQPAEQRHFFSTAIHYEPTTLITHFYHWFDLAQVEVEPHPSPIRRNALLYNIWDSRAEGLSTAVEELFMHAGLYDDNPRVREIVWIMLAQRAARGLGSLYAHANEMTLKQARDFHVEWTPRHWMRADGDLLGFEQQLYLRQPGYGSSYITGKYLIDRLIKDLSHQQEESFSLYRFFDQVNQAGLIPVSMIRWQLTGKDDEIKAILESYSEL